MHGRGVDTFLESSHKVSIIVPTIPRATLKRLILAGCAAGALLTGLCTAAHADGASLGDLPQDWHDDASLNRPLTGLPGRRVVITMAYASCHRICPMTMVALEQMQRAADARGIAVDFVVIGYDPKNDSPAAWHRYRKSRGLVRGNWHFLTGTPAATRQLANQLGFPFWTMDDDHVMHESRAVLFDAQGVQRAVLGLPTSRWADAL